MACVSAGTHRPNPPLGRGCGSAAVRRVALHRFCLTGTQGAAEPVGGVREAVRAAERHRSESSKGVMDIPQSSPNCSLSCTDAGLRP